MYVACNTHVIRHYVKCGSVFKLIMYEWFYLSSELLCFVYVLKLLRRSHGENLNSGDIYIFFRLVSVFSLRNCSQILRHLRHSAWRQKPQNICMKYEHILVAGHEGLVSVSNLGSHNPCTQPQTGSLLSYAELSFPSLPTVFSYEASVGSLTL